MTICLTLHTKYYGATNTRGARIQATPAFGKSVSIPYPYELSGQAVHDAAVRAWLDKYGYKDKQLNLTVGDGIGGGKMYIASTEATTI
jgi:hypothetical protein